MEIKPIKLPGYPTQLTDDEEVRDFQAPGGVYARVFMEARREKHGEDTMLVLTGQAWQMDKKGQFKKAPNGKASRSAESSATTSLSGLGKTVLLDDGWVAVPMTYNPDAEGAPYESVKARPTTEAEYGTRVWSTQDQTVYEYREGFADVFARTKVRDLLAVLETSDVHAGFTFRKNRKEK